MSILYSGLENLAMLILPDTEMQPEKRGKVSKGVDGGGWAGRQQSSRGLPAAPPRTGAAGHLSAGRSREPRDTRSGGSTTHRISLHTGGQSDGRRLSD